MKKLKKLQIINITLLTISTIILFWITNLHGFSGLCRWNPMYKKILIAMWAFNFINIILFLFSLKKYKNLNLIKLFRRLSITTTSLLSILLITMFIAFNIPSFNKSTDEYLFKEVAIENNLHENEPLLSLAVSSDPHWGSENSNDEVRTQILKNIGEANYDAFLCLGDIAEIGSTESFYIEAATNFEKYLNGTPVHVVMGNHDALINGTKVFKKYFQKNHDNYYSRVDFDDLHIITLDLLWDAEEFDATQEKWLIEQLEEIEEDDMTIILSHCFGYCSGYIDPETNVEWYDNKDVIEKVDNLIEEYNVELMLSGHNHLMELLKHGNTYYGIIGTMGGILDQTSDYISPQSIWLNNQTFGWLDIQVYENSLDLTFKDHTGKDLYNITIENNR